MTNSTYALATKDTANYEEGYKIFLQRSDFRERVIEKFSSLAATSVKANQHLRVLDLGCGNGLMTKRYVDEIKKITPHIDLSLLDPARQSLEEALVRLRTNVQTVTEVQSLADENSYDLIIASYVFYHLSPDNLDHVVNHLARNGSLAIMMGTNKHPLKSHLKLKSISNHGSSDKLNPFIENLLRSDNFKVSRHEVDTKLRLNGLWPNRRFTQEAKTLLSFSLNKDFDELSNHSIEALNEIFETAFTISDESLTSIHEVIWIERIR